MLEQVTAKNGDASRRAVAVHRQLILPVAVLLVLAAGVLAGLMLFNARVLDTRARDDSIATVREALNLRAGQLDRVVKDYAWWDEAVKEIQLNRNLAWADASLGSDLYGTHEYDWAFVVDPDDGTFHTALRGETVETDITTALGSEGWRSLVQRSRAAAAGIEPQPVHAFIPMRVGQPGIISATAIVPQASWSDKRPDGPPFVLVVVRALTREWFSELASALELDPLTFSLSTDTPATGLVLPGPEGREGSPAGSVSWQPHRPGTEYLLALAPSLGLALLLFVAFGWSALRQSRASTLAIVESEGRFRDVADASSDWIFETDAEGRLIWISERFIALTGIPLGEIEGRPIAELLLPMTGEDLSAELDQAMREHRLFRSIPRCYLDLEGRPRALRVSGSRPATTRAGTSAGVGPPPTSPSRSRPARPRSS